MFIICIFLIALGLFMILNPESYYGLTERWKSRSDSEPSDAYIKNTRFGGIMFLIVGAACLVGLLFLH